MLQTLTSSAKTVLQSKQGHCRAGATGQSCLVSRGPGENHPPWLFQGRRIAGPFFLHCPPPGAHVLWGTYQTRINPTEKMQRKGQEKKKSTLTIGYFSALYVLGVKRVWGSWRKHEIRDQTDCCPICAQESSPAPRWPVQPHSGGKTSSTRGGNQCSDTQMSMLRKQNKTKTLKLQDRHLWDKNEGL